ncbi:MAG TPA: peroxiredoxin family protein [Opitutaceae bacterium]
MHFKNYVLIGLLWAYAPALSLAQESLAGELEDARVIRPPAQPPAAAAPLHFAITCRSPETQAYFNHGIAALHTLDAKAADRAFYEAATREPECAMAWWGLAMAHIENRVLARYYLDKAVAPAARGPERERKWMSVVERRLQVGASEADLRRHAVEALSQIATEYPAEPEAAAFLVRQLVSNRDAGIPVPLPAAVDALIAQVLREHPEHPIAVYRLLWWEREQPQRVAELAERLRRALPHSSRVQTAAGRVHARLYQGAQAIESFDAALRLARKEMAAERCGPLEIPGYVENLDLLIAELRRAGRVKEALSLARHLIELPAVAAADESEPSATTGMEGMAVAGASLAPFTSSNADATSIGQRHLLGALLEYQRWDQLATAARSAHLASSNPDVQGLRIHALGLVAFAKGDDAGLVAQRDALAALFRQTRISGSGHGVDVQREAALARLQTLGRELELCRDLLASGPTIAPAALRTVATYGRVGDTAFALSTARQRASEPGASMSTLLEVAQLLELSGQPEAAKARLAEGKSRFALGDPDLSAADDGRKSSAASTALATELAPPLAPRWSLPDQNGRPVSRGQNRPMLLVFYRGAGCPHCIEQLAALAPLDAEFTAAGITLVGVSTDTVDGLRESYSAVGAKTALPFTLVSDHAQTTFRDYGAFNGRTQKALHGLFLIDAGGRIRWQSTSEEPFMAVKSLLAEARRALPLWAERPAALARASSGAP